MQSPHNSLIRSIRLIGNGYTFSLRLHRSRPQNIEEFLRENDLTDRIDFDSSRPIYPKPEAHDAGRQLTAA